MQSGWQQINPGSNDSTVSPAMNFGGLQPPLAVEEDWKVGVFGSAIGKSGIITADINNDGVTEIIAAGSTSTFGSGNFWYVLEYSPISQGYSRQWTSNLDSQGITKIDAFDLDNDGIYSIFIGLANGDIHIYDGASLQEVGYINSPASSINQILFADADNDSVNEIIVCDNQKTFLYNSTTLSLEHQIAYGGSDIEVGNVDSDSANEIVLSGGKVLEFNGVTTTEQWSYAGGSFGSLIELSDIDSDNIEEIIGASSWYYITAFDAELQSPKWQIRADLDINALLVTDVDNDGIEEVIYGDGQWGEIHAYDAVTVTQKWQISNPDHGVTNLAVFDTDSDGALEILWGAGASSTGADHLYVYGIPSLSKEWQSQHIDGPFNAIDVGDIDSDGKQEIVVASFESDSGYSDGTIFIYDAETHALEWQSPANMFGGYAWTGIHDLKIGDVDNDGIQEIVVATDRLYDGALYVINGQTKQIEHSYFYDDGAPIYSIDIADVDNDGYTEIIAGGGIAHSGAPGVYVYIINGSTGQVEWHSINLGGNWSNISSVKVGDIDNDGVPEIVALKDSLFVIDGISHQQWQSSLSGYSSLDLYDIDNDGIEDIIVGTNQGKIVAIDGQTLQEKFNVNVSSSPIVGLQAQDVDRDGTVELVFTSSAALGIYSIAESTLLWQSETLGSSAGNYNSLIVSNIDSDRNTEILVGTNYTVVEFEVSAIADNQQILNGSFETGDLTGWDFLGNASVVTADLGSTPTDGDYQASITTGNDSVSDAEIEDLLGLNAGDLDALGYGDATEGSVIQLEAFTVQAGDVLNFDWNFLTNETTPSLYNDFGFVFISSGDLSELADTSSGFTRFSSSYGSETGYGTFSYEFTESGSYTVAIGVVDVEDTGVDSALLLDNFELTSL